MSVTLRIRRFAPDSPRVPSGVHGETPGTSNPDRPGRARRPGGVSGFLLQIQNPWITTQFLHGGRADADGGGAVAKNCHDLNVALHATNRTQAAFGDAGR